MHVTANATSGPFTGITIVTPPSSGRAVVKGLDILYIPDPNITSTQIVTFTYTITNASGTSAPITVQVTVTPSSQKVSELERPALWNRDWEPDPNPDSGALLSDRAAAWTGGAA
jgi:hypothetical protein